MRLVPRAAALSLVGVRRRSRVAVLDAFSNFCPSIRRSTNATNSRRSFQQYLDIDEAHTS